MRLPPCVHPPMIRWVKSAKRRYGNEIRRSGDRRNVTNGKTKGFPTPFALRRRRIIGNIRRVFAHFPWKRIILCRAPLGRSVINQTYRHSSLWRNSWGLRSRRYYNRASRKASTQVSHSSFDTSDHKILLQSHSLSFIFIIKFTSGN